MNDETKKGWAIWFKRRRMLAGIGKISAVFFLISFLALIDGVQMLMRTANEEVTLIAGESTGISGVCPFQNPVQSDFILQFEPQDAPLAFTLEGFFAGYLMGNGMWRGEIKALPIERSSTYKLRVTFRGAFGAGQVFTLHVFPDQAAKNAASVSFLARSLGQQPFEIAAGFLVIAMGFGLVTYVLGKRNLILLQSLGFAEIFRTTPKGVEPIKVWCSALGDLRKPGETLPVYGANGRLICQGTISARTKNVYCLDIPADCTVEQGDLVMIRAV